MSLDRADWTRIPYHCVGGLREYLELGTPVGGFLEAVLSNDLREACGRADELNQYRLFDYIFFLHNYAPAGSWGSPKAYNNWLCIGGLKGLMHPPAQADSGAQ